ncbi:MAG: ABC transporter ATP-binding protein [Phycisphaerae bacterium]|nr:ABC transporter ATP-binding protein [Phycisphaerae bacterium]
MPVLQVSNLHKSYDNVRAVDGVSFSIDATEVLGLLGPNGAGKTTTINIIAALLTADQGEVTVDGSIRSTSPEYKRKLGYVPQEISLSEKLTARENLMLVGRLYDLHGQALARRVAEMLGAVGLSDRASDQVRTFSGGMKRRLNIAAALLHEPDLLLMDEPTAGVDPQARAYIFETVERLAEQGRAVLYTTHYMEEAQRLCRRIAIIDHGKILATGTLAELTQAVKAKRDLMIEADNLREDVIQRLAARLGNVVWTLDGDVAHLNVTGTDCSLLDALRAADEIGIRPRAISIHEPNLETVFLELTGRALRD